MNNHDDFLGHRLSFFAGGEHGEWVIHSVLPVKGQTLEKADRLSIYQGSNTNAFPSKWTLSGVKSNTRYVNKKEKADLLSRKPELGRPEAICGALIPIKKSETWWDLSQEERREIFESKSQHIAYGMKYLPQIARSLYHCRDLGGEFDFLTWFEYAPGHADEFEALVQYLRQTEEWAFVDREVDIRLSR